MSTEESLKSSLLGVVLILCLAVFWVLVSLVQEYTCLQSKGWFARSGAILVLASLWSGLITRRKVENAEAPDLLGNYESARYDTVPPKLHWASMFGVSSKLLGVELFLAFSGTVIWAYGDLWLPRC